VYGIIYKADEIIVEIAISTQYQSGYSTGAKSGLKIFFENPVIIVGIDIIILTVQIIIIPTTLINNVFHHCILRSDEEREKALPNPFFSKIRIKNISE
jgi:hypothetical protein